MRYVHGTLKETMEPKKETIYGQVVAKANHYMAVHGGPDGKRIIKDERIREYERSFVRQCSFYKDKMISQPFTIDLDIFYTSMRFDLDNSIKTILDCLQYSKAISDDNLCMGIHARKHIDKRHPRVTFSITEQMPSLFD